MAIEKKAMLARYGLRITSFDNFLLPKGTDSQRNPAPEIGFLRYSESFHGLEYFDNVGWAPIARGARYSTAVATATTVSVNEILPVNTTTAPVTITLPASPRPGERFTVFDPEGTWGTNSVTLDGNGSKINRNNQFELDNDDDFTTYVFTGVADLGWVREAGRPDMDDTNATIANKADITYVDTVHERQTDTDVSVAATMGATIKAFPASVRCVKMLISYIADTPNNTELFELLIIADKGNNVDFTVTGEVNSDPSVLTFDISYASGIVVNAIAALDGVYKHKVLWQSEQEL